MKICIYGAGVVGGLIASAHARAGHAVSVIARGPHLAAIRARGLTIVAPEGASVTTRPAASADPRDFGPQDLVIVATKTPAFADVAAHIGPLLGPDTLVGFAVNGIFWFYGDGFSPHGMKIEVPRLDPDGALHRVIGPARALGYVCWAGGEIREPGTVHANRGGGRIVAGAAIPETVGEAKAMIESLGVTDIAIEATTDIRTPMWRKYLGVVGNFATCTLTGATIAQAYGDAQVRDVLLHLTAEAIAVAAAHGFTNLGFDIEKARKTPSTSPHKPSMLQDLERGRRMEIESSYLVLQDLARAAGVKTPTIDAIVPLLSLRARLAGCF
jgi:2-dehydropantoate 2-reductase